MWTPAGRENPLAEQSHRKRQISEKGSPSCVRRNIDLPLSFSQIVHPIWDFTVPLLCFSIIVEERSSSLFQKKRSGTCTKKSILNVLRLNKNTTKAATQAVSLCCSYCLCLSIIGANETETLGEGRKQDKGAHCHHLRSSPEQRLHYSNQSMDQRGQKMPSLCTGCASTASPATVDESEQKLWLH